MNKRDIAARLTVAERHLVSLAVILEELRQEIIESAEADETPVDLPNDLC